MSYTPTNWVDGQTPVNAENLNKLEQGVADIHTAKENGELDGTPGKSAYRYAQEGGYTGTEEEFAQKLAEEVLLTTTTEVTPTQVWEAVSSGREVMIAHGNQAFGMFCFTSFNTNTNLHLIFSSSILQYNGMYAVVELIGDINTDTWDFVIQQVPIMTDIPTKTSHLKNDSGYKTETEINALIDTKLGVIENGSY